MVDQMSRLPGRRKHRTDYRHIADWLVPKPGAFEQCRYRKESFATIRFRKTIGPLKEQLGGSQGGRAPNPSFCIGLLCRCKELASKGSLGKKAPTDAFWPPPTIICRLLLTPATPRSVAWRLRIMSIWKRVEGIALRQRDPPLLMHLKKVLDFNFPNLRNSRLPVSQGSGQLPLLLLASYSNSPLQLSGPQPVVGTPCCENASKRRATGCNFDIVRQDIRYLGMSQGPSSATSAEIAGIIKSLQRGR
jgi:hypothetical protein